MCVCVCVCVCVHACLMSCHLLLYMVQIVKYKQIHYIQMQNIQFMELEDLLDKIYITYSTAY